MNERSKFCKQRSNFRFILLVILSHYKIFFFLYQWIFKPISIGTLLNNRTPMQIFKRIIDFTIIAAHILLIVILICSVCKIQPHEIQLSLIKTYDKLSWNSLLKKNFSKDIASHYRDKVDWFVCFVIAIFSMFWCFNQFLRNSFFLAKFYYSNSIRKHVMRFPFFNNWTPEGWTISIVCSI